MTLLQRMALILSAVMLLALGGSLAIQASTAQQALQRAGLRPDSDFDVPAWFVAAMPLASDPDRLGQPDHAPEHAWAYGLLWQICWRIAAWLAALALAAALLATWALRAWQRLLQRMLDQLQELEAGRLVRLEESELPELRGLTLSMNASLHRLRQGWREQADKVALLQRQAQLDMVTGLTQRGVFLAQLQARLTEPDGARAGLLLLRLQDLEGLNLRLGHDAADRLLRAIADVLLTYVDRVPGTLAGRLKGSDFALCLPVAGVARETASSLRDALAALSVVRSAAAQVVVGGVDGVPHAASGAALAAADAALARAEAGEGGGQGVVVEPNGDGVADAPGARLWRTRIAAALEEGRARLDEVPVMDRAGGRMFLACTMALQLERDGEFHPACRWLALARRSRLLPQVDLMAVALALRALKQDASPRAVRISAPALAEPAFVADIATLLDGARTQARSLWLEIAEPARPDLVAGLVAAIKAWRAYGVQMGIEHGGALPQTLLALQAVGIDYVKLDGRPLRGLSQDASVQAYAGGLVKLIQGLGMTALADGLDDEQDLATLWTLGLDGVQTP